MASEWQCHSCTFSHAFPGTRCSMCDKLRTTTQDMADFVTGKTIRKDTTTNPATSSSSSSSNDKPSNDGVPRDNNRVAGSGPVVQLNADSNNLPVKSVPKALIQKNKGNGNSSTSSNNKSDRQPTIVNPYLKSSHSNKNHSTSNMQNSNNRSSQQTSNLSIARSNARPKVQSQQQTNVTSGNTMNSQFIQSATPPINLNQKKPQNQIGATNNRTVNPYAKNASSRQQETTAVQNTLTNTKTSVNNNQFRHQARNHDRSTSIVDDNIAKISTWPHNGINPLTSNTSADSNSNFNSNTALQNTTTTAFNRNQIRLKERDVNPPIPSDRSRNIQQKGTNPATTDSAQQRLQSLGFRGRSTAKDAEKIYEPGPVPLATGNLHKTWIYPKSEKYAEREYQLAISRSCLLENTLVSLPTGLGKTLIAAVVMYNFYRWFPTGKIVFLAPTRPLVRQQIEACYNIMGIPEVHTAEISGNVKNRERLWRMRRVFFCTPQAFERDIENGLCDIGMVVCLVLDEAHKTTKKYAYNNVVQRLQDAGVKARIVGLSATPGRDLKGIQTVIDNLGVSKIEARLDTDSEVKPYVHDRSYEIITVEQCTAANTIERLLNKNLNPLIDMLRERNGLPKFQGANLSLSSYALLLAQQSSNQHQNFSLNQQYTVVSVLLKAKECLGQNGIKMARNKLSTFMEQYGGKGGYAGKILQSDSFMDLWSTIVKLQDTGKSFSQDNAEDLKLNNPKLDKLDFVLKEHFERAKACNESSRAIVFSQFRESVEEIVGVLRKSAPLIQATKFVGQGTGTSIEDSSTPTTKRTTTSRVAGMNQKEQQQVIRDFRDGKHNVLVCTSIGEEGLDIGQVDLIVNFDCLRSPIRMVQRTGRTGRKRDGRVVCLLSKGREEEKLRSAESDTKRLWNALKSNTFLLAENVPLLPGEPILNRVNMNVVREYRLSQIGGHSQKSERQKKSLNAFSVDMNSWRLNNADERKRRENYGNCVQNSGFVRQAIKAWQKSVPTNKRMLRKRPLGSLGVGQTSSVLREIESATVIEERMQEGDNEGILLDCEDSCEIASEKRDLLAAFCKYDKEPHMTPRGGSFDESDGDYGVAVFSPPDNEYCIDIFPGDKASDESGVIIECVEADPVDAHTDVDLDAIFGLVSKQSSSQLCPRSFNIVFGDSLANCAVEPPSDTNSHHQWVPYEDDSSAEMCVPSPRILLPNSSHEMIESNSPPRQMEETEISIAEETPMFEADSSVESATNVQTSYAAETDTMLQDNNVTGQQYIVCNNKRTESMREVPFDSEPASTSMDVDDMSNQHIQKTIQLSHKETRLTPNEESKNDLPVDINCDKNSADDGMRTSFNDDSICFDLGTQDSSSSSSDSDSNDSDQSKEILESASLDHDAQVDLNPDKGESNDATDRPTSNASAKETPGSTNRGSRLKFRPKSSLALKPDDFDESHRVDKDDTNDETPLLQRYRHKTIEASTDKPLIASQNETPVIRRSRNSKKTVDLFLSQFPTPSSQHNTHTASTPHNNQNQGAANPSKTALTVNLFDTPASDQLKDIPLSRSSKRKIDVCVTKRAHFDLEDTPLTSSSSQKRKMSELTVSDNVKVAKQRRVEQLLKRRKTATSVCKFLDIEAEVGTDDSGDEDEDDNGLSQDSFINDSSQLGFTQDMLDSLDCDSQPSSLRHVGALHRQVDMTKEQEEIFATPVLRRRRKEHTQLSLPSSEKKMGGMHFIRSVIEHHRKGGNADELERGYHDILRECGTRESQESSAESTQGERMQAVTGADQANKTTSATIPQHPPLPSKPSTLTAAQLERIRINKEKALLLRQQKQHKM